MSGVLTSIGSSALLLPAMPCSFLLCCNIRQHSSRIDGGMQMPPGCLVIQSRRPAPASPHRCGRRRRRSRPPPGLGARRRRCSRGMRPAPAGSGTRAPQHLLGVLEVVGRLRLGHAWLLSLWGFRCHDHGPCLSLSRPGRRKRKYRIRTYDAKRLYCDFRQAENGVEQAQCKFDTP